MKTRWLPGACSVTLRSSSIDEVASLAGECGLRAIEWGGDVHVPPCDEAATRRARAASASVGVEYLSYGSYLGVRTLPDSVETARVLDTAVALGAGNVRVWTPLGTAPTDEARTQTADALASVCDAAQARALTISLEFHGGTLTENAASTLALLATVDAPNLFSYWQVPYWRAHVTEVGMVDDLCALAPRLSHLHVYEWDTEQRRHPLGDGATRWRQIFDALDDLTGRWPGPRAAFLEFVADDDPAAVRRDAATLCEWLAVS